MLGEQPCDRSLLGGDLEPAHGSAAASASVHVGAEYMPEQPYLIMLNQGCGVAVQSLTKRSKGFV